MSKYYFNLPNYSKIGGRPIVYLDATSLYLCDNCQEKKEREELLKHHVELMRETAKRNGYNPFLIGDYYHKEGVDELIVDLFDAVTSYNLHAERNPNKYKWTTDERGNRISIAPYDDMVDAAIKKEKEIFDVVKKKDKFYIPFANAGFDYKRQLRH